MGASVERIFLGWDRPFLELAAPRWIEHVRERALEPGRCVLVLPARRAARRLEERLAQLAPADWAPPRVISEGELAAVLRVERVSRASEWQRALAWREALEASSREQLDALWRGVGAADVTGLARVCARAFDELAREGLDGAAAAQVGALPAQERWRAFAALERRYLAALETRGVCDPAALARDALAAELRTDLHVQLFALADPPRALRRLVERLRGVCAFVFAPEHEAAGFDALGALRSEAWAERGLEFDSARWRVVDGPDEQAQAALEVLASIEPPPAPEAVAIGVPDEDVLPFLERRLLEAGCEPRWAGGRPLAHSRAAQLLLAALDWLARPAPEEFARLVAQPDFERLCDLPGGALGAALDRFVAEHVPTAIDGVWPTLVERRLQPGVERLERARARALELFASLNGASRARSERWATALSTWSAAAWGADPLDSREPQAWRHARALELLAGLIEELREADAPGGGLELDAALVRELLAARMESLEVPPPPGDGRPLVELFGWLELVLDDAPNLVVTGVQEGALPASSGAAGLLSESAREQLGLGHEARRVARDVWATSAILASRSLVTLISGRRNSQRDPLRPSRLLFRCASAQLVERVERAFGESHAAAPAASAAPASYTPPLAPRPAPTSLRVTDFRTYLESPYAFYVLRVLGLESAAPRVLELDARAFGSLAHAVLEALRDEELSSCSDAQRLQRGLETRLDQLARARFGAAPSPTVALQIERLRGRLARFARWQARQREEGWSIEHLEWEAPRFELEGVTIRGRIDRIERHERSGAWRVLDYKTGDKLLDPLKAHYSPTHGWRDLQLPLYRELTRPLCGDEPVQLGYVGLSREAHDDLLAEFAPAPELLDEALDTAREVVRRIRAGEFAQVGDRPPFDASLAALCGYGLLATDEDSDDEEAAE